AEVDVVGHGLGKRTCGDPAVVLAQRTDRARGARDERHRGPVASRVVVRLLPHVGLRLARRTRKCCRCELATQITIDARAVDEEVTVDILGNAITRTRHTQELDAKRAYRLPPGWTGCGAGAGLPPASCVACDRPPRG